MVLKQIYSNKQNRKIKILIIYCFVVVLSLLFSTKVNANPRMQQISSPVRIVIDPGHGGSNDGTKENDHLEKEMTMVTALAMYDRLSQFDNVEVFLTHTDDIDLSLKERAEYAASVNADFLFSIHYNASEYHTLFGSEVWVSCKEPYNTYGYQFGCYQMEQMRDMGLFIRGIKTRIGKEGKDYYGIIRESGELGIPAVIIEHCHVDHEEDEGFCDEQNELVAFGQADALSVAKYFGLKSSSLGLDFSNTSSEQDRSTSAGKVSITYPDETEPDVCEIKLLDLDKENGIATIKVTGADYDSPLLYYDYSFDGGETYSRLYQWPGSDAYAWTYDDTFETQITLPIGMPIRFILRASNFSDKTKESNLINIPSIKKKTEEDANSEEENKMSKDLKEAFSNTAKNSERNGILNDDTIKLVKDPEEKKKDFRLKGNRFLLFILISVLIVSFMFSIITLSQIISNRRHKKRARRRKIAQQSQTMRQMEITKQKQETNQRQETQRRQATRRRQASDQDFFE